MNKPREHPGFTLIEVLMVVAVIGLLTALLLPSLSAARASAESAVCLSNVRQLALGGLAYAGDHREHFPPGAPSRLANLVRWHGSRASAGEAFSPSGGSLTPYLEGAEAAHRAVERAELVRVCPTFTPTLRALAAARAGFERSCGGYGYNTAFVGSLRSRASSGVSPLVTDLSGQRTSWFDSPAQTAFFADAALADGNRAAGVIEYSFLEPRFWPEAPAQRPDPSAHFRHARPAGVASVVWLDGHARGERMTMSWSSGLYPAVARDLAIGWFGRSDDNTLFGQ